MKKKFLLTYNFKPFQLLVISSQFVSICTFPNKIIGKNSTKKNKENGGQFKENFTGKRIMYHKEAFELVDFIEDFLQFKKQQEVFSAFSNNEKMKDLLTQVPAKWFFQEAHKLINSFDGSFGAGSLIASKSRILCFLAVVKLALKLEKFNIQTLSHKYKFDINSLFSMAKKYGLNASDYQLIIFH